MERDGPRDDDGCDEPVRYDGAYSGDKTRFDNSCYYHGVLDLKDNNRMQQNKN